MLFCVFPRTQQALQELHDIEELFRTLSLTSTNSICVHYRINTDFYKNCANLMERYRKIVYRKDLQFCDPKTKLWTETRFSEGGEIERYDARPNN